MGHREDDKQWFPEARENSAERMTGRHRSINVVRYGIWHSRSDKALDIFEKLKEWIWPQF